MRRFGQTSKLKKLANDLKGCYLHEVVEQFANSKLIECPRVVFDQDIVRIFEKYITREESQNPEVLDKKLAKLTHDLGLEADNINIYLAYNNFKALQIYAYGLFLDTKLMNGNVDVISYLFDHWLSNIPSHYVLPILFPAKCDGRIEDFYIERDVRFAMIDGLFERLQNTSDFYELVDDFAVAHPYYRHYPIEITESTHTTQVRETLPETTIARQKDDATPPSTEKVGLNEIHFPQLEYRGHTIVQQMNGDFRIQGDHFKYYKTQQEALKAIDHKFPCSTMFEAEKYCKTIAAATRIEYDTHAKEIWLKLNKSSAELSDLFLQKLDLNPKQDVDLLFNELMDDNEQSNNRYQDPRVNEAFKNAAKLGENAKKEFQRVYEMLGETLYPEQILERIEMKFGDKPLRSVDKKKAQLPSDWKKILAEAINKGHETSMLLALDKLGYSVSLIDKTITRPIFSSTNSHGLMTYATPSDLKKICEAEQKNLEEIDAEKL